MADPRWLLLLFEYPAVIKTWHDVKMSRCLPHRNQSSTFYSRLQGIKEDQIGIDKPLILKDVRANLFLRTQIHTPRHA